MAATSEIRDRVERVKPARRLSSAIGNVCGITAPAYLPTMRLAGELRCHPEVAAELAALQAENAPDGAALRLAQLTEILDVLDGLEVDATAAQLAALGVYRDELARRLTGQRNADA